MAPFFLTLKERIIKNIPDQAPHSSPRTYPVNEWTSSTLTGPGSFQPVCSPEPRPVCPVVAAAGRWQEVGRRCLYGGSGGMGPGALHMGQCPPSENISRTRTSTGAPAHGGACDALSTMWRVSEADKLTSSEALGREDNRQRGSNRSRAPRPTGSAPALPGPIFQGIHPAPSPQLHSSVPGREPGAGMASAASAWGRWSASISHDLLFLQVRWVNNTFKRQVFGFERTVSPPGREGVCPGAAPAQHFLHGPLAGQSWNQLALLPGR